jgi:hypothetical protein
MDMTLLDVTDVPNVAIDDCVMLGSEGEAAITAEDLGELAGQFPTKSHVGSAIACRGFIWREDHYQGGLRRTQKVVTH